MNMAASAESLVDDSAAYAEDPSETNYIDMLASMRILHRRIVMAAAEMGEVLIVEMNSA